MTEVMTESTSIQQILAGKRVLFVEDRPETIALYIEELEETVPDLEIESVEKLEKAWKLLGSGKTQPPFDIVLIDLNIPPVPEVLQEYAENLEARDLNEGQALGLWLSDKYPHVKYAYLSAVSRAIDKGVDASQAKIMIIDKYTVMPDELPKKLCEVWTQ
ncbi:MAG: hypothetical protein GY862_16340 [Gammaproteobacteria bacterium]|nr:hypothetical protein [Gammaproteobacteria bacterium]